MYPPLLSTALPCTNDNIPPTLSSAVCPPPVSHAIAVCCNMEENQLTEGRKDFCKPCTGCACSVTKLISFHFPFLVSFRHRPFQRPFSLVSSSRSNCARRGGSTLTTAAGVLPWWPKDETDIFGGRVGVYGRAWVWMWVW